MVEIGPRLVSGVWACGCGCGCRMSPGRHAPLRRSAYLSMRTALCFWMHVCRGDFVLFGNLLPVGNTPRGSINQYRGYKTWFCSIFAPSAPLWVKVSWPKTVPFCFRLCLSPLLFVLVCLHDSWDFTPVVFVIGGVSGARVSLHNDSWAKCFPASALTRSLPGWISSSQAFLSL